MDTVFSPSSHRIWAIWKLQAVVCSEAPTGCQLGLFQDELTGTISFLGMETLHYKHLSIQKYVKYNIVYSQRFILEYKRLLRVP